MATDADFFFDDGCDPDAAVAAYHAEYAARYQAAKDVREQEADSYRTQVTGIRSELDALADGLAEAEAEGDRAVENLRNSILKEVW